ncbi:MAG: hypothetical protein AAGI90_06275 [Chlamydiota bacterium]
MKQLQKRFVSIVMFLSLWMSCSLFADINFDMAPELRLGRYRLEGSALGSNIVSYTGEVDIAQHGENFLVKWWIGNTQSQTGIGILLGRTLSVSFYDDMKATYGVAVFYLSDYGYLKGYWTFHNRLMQGKEELTFLW